MKKSLLSLLLFFLTTSFVSARIIQLNNNITIDTDTETTRIGTADDCGPNYTGETCLLSCFVGMNDAAKVYTCDVGMTMLYYEVWVDDSGSTPTSWYSGNSLETKDERSVIFYPYQTAKLCFNLGRALTEQPVMWEPAEGYPKSTATSDDGGPDPCMEAPIDGSPTSLW